MYPLWSPPYFPPWMSPPNIWPTPGLQPYVQSHRMPYMVPPVGVHPVMRNPFPLFQHLGHTPTLPMAEQSEPPPPGVTPPPTGASSPLQKTEEIKYRDQSISESASEDLRPQSDVKGLLGLDAGEDVYGERVSIQDVLEEREHPSWATDELQDLDQLSSNSDGNCDMKCDEREERSPLHDEMRDILQYLEVGGYPPGMTKNEKANFRKRCKNFKVVDRKLFHKTKIGKLKEMPRDNFPDFVLVVTDKRIQKKLVKMAHEGGKSLESAAMSAHRGINATHDILARRVWWPNISTDVRLFVTTCDRCQKVNKATLKGRSELKSIPPPREVLRMIGVDLCMLPEVEGYKYVAVAIDYLSKFSFAKPLKEKTAVEVADFLMEWVYIFGCFSIQINDQGTEFNNAVIDEMHKRLGVEHRVSSAYHPQTNGEVERQNETIKNGLLKVLESKEDWPRALQGVMFAHRTQKHASTGYSPYQLLFNQEPILPLDFVTRQDLDGNKPEIGAIIPGYFEDEEYPVQVIMETTDQIMNIAQKMRAKARTNIKEAQKKQKKYYDSRNKKTGTFVEGEQVLMVNYRRNDRKGGWSQDPFLGPYKIVRIGGNGSCKLLNLKNNKELTRWVNVKSLKKYKARQEEVEVDSPDTEDEDNCKIKEEKIEETNNECDIKSKKSNIDVKQDQQIIKAETQYKTENKNEDENHEERTMSDGDSDIVMDSCTDGVTYFFPVGVKWQKEKCAEKGLKLSVKLNTNTKIKPFLCGEPSSRVQIAMDGNCYFRAIAHALTGSQEDHHTIRALITSYMKTPEMYDRLVGYDKKFSTERWNMTKPGVWATDLEIISTAKWLNTVIYVYSKGYSGKCSWQVFRPTTLESVSGVERKKTVEDYRKIPQCRCLYLSNLNNHYEFVTAAHKM